MAQQNINLGSVANDGTGDNLRAAGTKVNANFTELYTGKQDVSAKGAANGYCGLDASQLVPAVNLPSYVDDVLEYANFAALPGTGATGKIYVLATPYTSGGVTSSQFRWSGSAYAAIVASPGSTDAVTEGTTNLYFTAARVRSAVLTGLSSVTAAAIAATDSVLQAFEKLQAQVSSKLSADLATAITTAKSLFSNTDQGILLDAAASGAPKTFTGAVMRTKPVVVLGTTGTVNLDIDVLVGCLGTIVATGDITLTTSNRAAGKGGELRIDANGGTRTITYPAWNAFGAALTTSITSGQVLRIAYECTGTTDASIDATSILKV